MSKTDQEARTTPAEREGLYRVGQWNGHPNYQCTRCPYATLSKQKIEGHVRTPHVARRPVAATRASSPAPELAGDGGPLAGIDFASDEASELASTLALTARDFDGLGASGVRGYTTADVRRAAEQTTTSEEE